MNFLPCTQLDSPFSEGVRIQGTTSSKDVWNWREKQHAIVKALPHKLENYHRYLVPFFF